LIQHEVETIGRIHEPEKHTELLYHCPYRSRQVHAC
jgi:hypothetical protein